MIGIVVANGPSRKDADLSKLPGMGTVIACNQTHELVECDYAVALDKVNYVKYSEIKDRKFKGLTRLVKTADKPVELWMENEYLMPMADINDHWCNDSGIVAAGFLATYCKCDTVYLVGFDFFRYREGDPKPWCYHEAGTLTQGWNNLIDKHADTKFVRVGTIPTGEYVVPEFIEKQGGDCFKGSFKQFYEAMKFEKQETL